MISYCDFLFTAQGRLHEDRELFKRSSAIALYHEKYVLC